MSDGKVSILPQEKQEYFGGLLNSQDTAPELVGGLIVYAIDNNVSDILLDPGLDKAMVRFRIDGILHFIMEIPRDYYTAVVSRLKIMAELDITQHRKAQEGKIDFEHNNRLVNLRMAVAEVITGESVALRLHDTRSIIYTLESLGLQEPGLSTYRSLLSSKSGLILTCGPTGAGKTSTLYSTLNILNTGESNIISIEDPIEYILPGINQMQTDPKHGITFAEGLKIILRLNPDIIFVGEIRDEETAHIAVESAMTGHLVLSTIHANSAAAVLPRLADLKVEPFFINSAVTGAISQRLVRRVCPACAQDQPMTQEEQDLFYRLTGENLATQSVGQGCEQCSHTGFKGRIGLFEVMAVNDAVRAQVKEGASVHKIEAALQAHGFKSIVFDGMMKVKQRVTTVNEVMTNAFVSV